MRLLLSDNSSVSSMEMGALKILLTGLVLESAVSGQGSEGAAGQSVVPPPDAQPSAETLVDQAVERSRLHDVLLKTYDRHQVPLDPKTGEGVNVTIYMWPYDILYVNEARGSIKISGWIDMRWKDPFLVWDPDKYGGIKHTHLPANRVWLPIVDLFYSKEDVKVVAKCSECPVRTDHKGNVLQGYYFSYSFPCSINVKYFPFDMQRCTLELANWHLDDSMMDLYAQGTSVDLSIFLPNEEWDLMSMNVTRKREFYNYGYFPILSYTLEIRRKSGYYVQNLVIPTLILTVTALLGYHMPSTGTGIHQEKVKMGLTTILSIFILQLGVSDKLPKTSDVVPLILIFYSCMVGLLSFAIIATSLIIMVEKQGVYGEPPPAWVRRFLICGVGKEEDAEPAIAVAQLHAGHKHCRMLDCGCRLKTSPRLGYMLLSPESSPEPSRFVAVGPTLGNGTVRQRGSVGARVVSHPSQASAASAQTTDSALPDQCGDCAETRGPATKGSGRSVPSTSFLTLALLEAVKELGELGAERSRLEAKKRQGSKVRAQWRRLADILEYISLVGFILASILCTLLFTYHGWY